MKNKPINRDSLWFRGLYWIFDNVVVNIVFRIIVYLWLGKEGLIAFGFTPPPVFPGPIVKPMAHDLSPEIAIELETALGLIRIQVIAYSELEPPYVEYQMKLFVPVELEAKVANLLNDWRADVVHYPSQKNIVPMIVTIPVAVSPERFEIYFKTKWVLSLKESL